MLKKYFLLFFLAAGVSFAQETANQYKTIADFQDPVALIGVTVQELITLFGPPKNVYAVRGAESWQDDVVFEYDKIDFYIYRNHIWQITPPKINNISLGDPKAVIMLVYGGNIIDNGTYVITELPGRAWKIETRYNIDAEGKISAIYVYRTDY